MTLTGEEPDLQLGDTGEGVILLQVRLYGLQLLRDVPDGAYGMSTENAVRMLQSQLGLDNTGEVTRETWEGIVHLEQQYSIQYQYMSPYDALGQIQYDLQHPAQSESGHGQLSEDGLWRWDGTQWQSASADGYAGQLSEDGQWRWDGSQWQPA
jgi:peptidoglycan hydrolase-like protein with peptidoglycan-binding domain